MSTIKLILFDLDDTLIHFEDYWEPSLLETFRQHQSTRDLDSNRLFEILLRKNSKFEKMYHKQEISISQYRNFRLIHTLLEFDRTIDENIAENFNQLHKNISKSFMKADNSLTELLLELKQTYSFGIVTNGLTSWQLDKIDAMGIRTLFEPEAIIISEDVGFEKPAPEIYKKALSIFKVPVEETLFVGDSWTNDVEGPGRLGIRSVWFNKKKEQVPQHPMLTGVITNIKELKHFLS